MWLSIIRLLECVGSIQASHNLILCQMFMLQAIGNSWSYDVQYRTKDIDLKKHIDELKTTIDKL